MLTSWNFDKVVDLLVQAAHISQSMIDSPETEMKSDCSPVTRADRAVENFMTEQLENTAENCYLIGEETVNSKQHGYLEQALKNTAWIIDPIDGTAEFANKVPFWGNSIGYSENGVILEGGILVPGTGEMMISNKGVTYYANEGSNPAFWDFHRNLKPLTPPSEHFDESCIISLSQQVCKLGRIHSANTINTLCSSVYAAILLATGRYGAIVTRAKLWDHAGYVASLKNLGFQASAPVEENNILSMNINDQIYKLDLDASDAFALRKQHTVIAKTRETIEKVHGYLTMPES